MKKNNKEYQRNGLSIDQYQLQDTIHRHNYTIEIEEYEREIINTK